MQNYARHVFNCSQCLLVALVQNYTDPKVHFVCPWSASVFIIQDLIF